MSDPTTTGCGSCDDARAAVGDGGPSEAAPPAAAASIVKTKRTIAAHAPALRGEHYRLVDVRVYALDGNVETLMYTAILGRQTPPGQQVYVEMGLVPSVEWGPGPITVWGPEGPPKQLIQYLLWKLNYAEDSFRGGLVALLGHADRDNLERLRSAFPFEVHAWEAWQKSADGEFEVPDDCRP